MNIVPIAFSFDNNLVFPACVCISSLLISAEENTFYDIFILHSDNELFDREKLDGLLKFYKRCRIQYRLVDNTFDDAFEIRGITTSTYNRLLIPEIVTEYDKIIYSDVDVIFRSDLFEVYNNTDLSDAYVAGVNAIIPLVPDMRKYYEGIKGIDINKIIYAGNIIFNSKKIREDKVVERFKSLSKNKYRFQDLDILNIACKGKITYLNPEFCLTTYIMDLAVNKRSLLYDYWDDIKISEALSKGIVHYNGQKPWKGFCVNFDIWWEYYRKSPFSIHKVTYNYLYSFP